MNVFTESETSSSMETNQHPLTPAQIHQLMTVIAGMDSVKEAGSDSSPPPTDEEIQQFLDYVGCGQVNSQRMEYEEERQVGTNQNNVDQSEHIVSECARASQTQQASLSIFLAASLPQHHPGG